MEQEIFNPGDEIQMACLCFSFAQLLQDDLDKVKQHWYTNLIKGCSHDTISGRPDELFSLPELHGKSLVFFTQSWIMRSNPWGRTSDQWRGEKYLPRVLWICNWKHWIAAAPQLKRDSFCIKELLEIANVWCLTNKNELCDIGEGRFVH